MACSEVSKHLVFSFIKLGFVYSANLDVFPIDTDSIFSILQSSIHEEWARTLSATLETRLKYSPGNAFETFPFPQFKTQESRTLLEKIGERYYQHRLSIMPTRQEGLTKTYNRFHNPAETSPDIAELRRMHVAMDEAVAAAYGWHDLLSPDCRSGLQPATSDDRGLKPAPTVGLAHGFHETKQGIRYTISEEARREVLDRLLELNHQRYAEEVAAGLHDKKANKPAAKRDPKPAPTGATPQVDMFGHAQLDVFDTPDVERKAEDKMRRPE